jgi:hypothetical protein
MLKKQEILAAYQEGPERFCCKVFRAELNCRKIEMRRMIHGIL